RPARYNQPVTIMPRCFWKRSVLIAAPLLGVLCAVPSNEPLTDAFETGWMLADTNGDGIADLIAGKIVVPDRPSAIENTAAADLAARLAFGSTGLTLPLVV